MRFASKWFLASVAIALLVVIYGAGNYFVSNKLLNDAIAECEQDKVAKAKRPPSQSSRRLVLDDEKKPTSRFYDLIPPEGSDCDTAIQARIGMHRSNSNDDVFYDYCLFALLILFIGGIPHLWYFFLRRLAEVAAAIRGKQ